MASWTPVRPSCAEREMGGLQAGEGLGQLPGAALSGRGRVVELVRHARAEPAQRGQLLALAQRDLLLQVGLFQVAQPLLLQARIEARAQQHRVEGLGQIVFRAHLDAAHRVVDLVDRGNHDDRDIAQVGVALDSLQHLEAVQPGHDDVEQHAS